MKKFRILSLIAMFSGVATIAFAAQAQDYSNAMKVFRDSPVVSKFFKDSYGYAIFPTIGKAGFVVGGSYGDGQVYRGGKATGKTSVVEGSIGLQIGAEAFSEMIFFQNKQAYDKFTSGSFEFDATAQAVVITAGVDAQAGTTGSSAGATAGPKTESQVTHGYMNGMATFVHAKGGLMAEMSLGGQKFSFTPYK